MRMKKIIASLLAVSLAFSEAATGAALQATTMQTFAADTAASEDGYFYAQLKPEAKVFYDAMVQMDVEGLFKTGNGELDLTAAGYLTQEEAAGYAESGTYVLNLFGAARDAFSYDHNDLFYVDFSSLSVRATSGQDGYHIYLGTGRRDNYYMEGFTSAEQVDSYVSAYESAVKEIAAGALAAEPEEGESAAVAQVRYAHNYIINHTSYRLEDRCKEENLGFIRTAYGSLVAGEAVCEGYSRAFKAVMDELGIPCVLVNGIYQHEDVPELHMWTMVEIDGEWYGVDATMDDPITQNESVDGVDGAENEDLLLVGDDILSRHHQPSGVLSEANYEFCYPVAEFDSYGVETQMNEDGLVVQYKADSEMEGIPAGDFIVSYHGMGYAKAAEQGKYIIVRFVNEYENGEIVDSGWCYIEPQYYPGIVDTDTALTLTLASVQNVQFAVTDIPPKMNENGYPDLLFDEEPVMLAQSNVIHNENGYYMPAPYARYLSPRNSGSMMIEQGKRHVTATYDEVLVPVEGEDFTVEMTCSTQSGKTHSVFENIEWDGESTISFDFAPSDQWADDRASYTFTVKGLVSARSGKAPDPVTYTARFNSYTCAYRSQGYYWNLFAQPTLIDNSDISISDWQTSDGSTVSDKLTDRMVLVATSPSHAQTDTMNELIEKESAEPVLSSQTFNIDITICNKKFISTGDGVRLSLGFPEGYGPEDEGVTFKVYHFIQDADGNITGTEEIPCTITKYGLVVLCKSFSPYAVVAVEDDGTASAQKSVIATGTAGGTVTGTESIATLAEGDSTTLSVKADEGYVIESISVGGSYVDITDQNAMELTIGYDEITGDSCIVDVKFAAEAVIEKEAERGETAVQIDSEAEKEKIPDITPEETTTTSEATTTTPEETTTTSEATTTTSEVTTTTAPEETTTTPVETTETTTATESTTSVTVIPGDENQAAQVQVVQPDGQTDVYLLYAIDSLNYAKVGYTIHCGEQSAVWDSDTVYEAVVIEGKTYTAEEFGGKYLVALEVSDMPEDAARKAVAVPKLRRTEKLTAELPKKTVLTPDGSKEEIV